MKRKSNFLPAFVVVFFLCVLILVLNSLGSLKSISSFFEKEASSIQLITFRIFQKLPFVSEDTRIKELEDKNLEFLSKISDYEKVKRENQALSDQFQTAYPQSTELLKVNIIGASAFVPGVSIPDIFVVDRGAKNNLKVGMAIVIKDNLVGIISKVSENLSEVNTVNNALVSFTAKTEGGVVGIIKREEGLTLDNILLSENLSKGELVLTKGDVDSNGVGIPPNLIVGKIISIEKKPSELFQKAKVESFVDFVHLSTVFVYVENK
jgi:rod shape-determining protein MreC